jgi:hypothetical protein
VLFLVPFVSCFRSGRKAGLLVVAVLTQMAYSVHVGGDAWEWWGGANRYITVVMPAFIVLFACGLRRTLGWVAQGILGEKATHLADSRCAKLALAALTMACAVDLGTANSTTSVAEFFLVKPPLSADENKGMVNLALQVKQFTTPQARLGVLWAGAIPYFAERPAVDILGKSDRHIARLKAPVASGLKRYYGFYPGHMKWDIGYTLDVQKPDVIPFLFTPMLDASGRHLTQLYQPLNVHPTLLYLRRHSPRILWERLPATR